MRKCLATKTIARCAALFLFCLLPLKGICQTGESTVNTLVEMGFENVGWTEDTEERVFVIQNSAYRLEGVGIGKAVDLIQKMGLPENKPCRLIVLDNNVPQISLYYQPMKGDSIAEVSRADWSVSYDLGEGWKQARRIKKQNSSLFKVDIVVYPELLFRNYILSKVYEIVVNVSPASVPLVHPIIGISIKPDIKGKERVFCSNDARLNVSSVMPKEITILSSVDLKTVTLKNNVH